MRNRLIPSSKGRTEPASLVDVKLCTSCLLYHVYIQQIMQSLILSTLEGG